MEYYALIYIPVRPNNFDLITLNFVEEILIEYLITNPKIFKEKEKELFDLITNKPEKWTIKRNFNLRMNDKLINISKMHNISEDENLNIEQYLKDFENKIKNIDSYSNFTNLAFAYSIKYNPPLIKDNISFLYD